MLFWIHLNQLLKDAASFNEWSTPGTANGRRTNEPIAKVIHQKRQYLNSRRSFCIQSSLIKPDMWFPAIEQAQLMVILRPKNPTAIAWT